MNPDTRSEIVPAEVQAVGLKDGKIKYAALWVRDVRFPGLRGSDTIFIDNKTLDLQPGEAVTIEIRRSL